MYKEIVLAAWLYDIGKFAQRAGLEWYCSKDLEGQLCKLQQGGWYSHKHVLYTEGFLQSVKDVLPGELNVAEVIRLAASHHNPSSYHEWLVTHGDRLSSGTDRRDVLPDKADETPACFYEKPLTHLLSTLHLKEAAQAKRAYSPLKALEQDAILAVTNSKVSKEQYRALWDQFERDFLALKGLTYPDFMLSLDTLLERYFWCIPSATNDDADISLYQHSKTTAAFAGALYRYHEARQTETPDALDHDEPKFLFINGDMSGIQKYIFDLKGTDENAKLLRARSFELWALSEIIAEYLVAQFNVSWEHIVTLAGGKFLLLVPNTDAARKRVPELRLKLERYFIDEFAGKLAFVLSDGVPASYADVRKEGIQKLLNEIVYITECAKQRKMQAAFMADGQILDSLYDELQENGECACCETMPNKHAGNDGNLCRNCAKLIDIGRDLLRANKIILKPETLSHFGLMLEIRKKDDSSFGSIINEFKPRYPLMFLPYVAPWKDEAHGELKTFEEIADTSAGANKVAMFKADIDNLGLVFSSSMGEGKDNGMVTVIAITATVVCSTLFGFGGMSGVEFIQFFLWTYFNQTLYHLAYAALFTMLAFISRNAAMTILLGVGWTVVEMMVIGFLGNYQGGSLAFARQIFPGLYIGIFYSVEYDLYWYNNATQIIKGIATSMLFIGASSITGITLFLKNDIK